MSEGANFTDSIQSYDMPSRKAILQYLVRTGSFTLAPKIENRDTADVDVTFPDASTWEEMGRRCREEIQGHLEGIAREDIFLPHEGGEYIRVMQWNILAQALAEGSDNFTACPPDALTWQFRRWRLLAEMVENRPDILCLQEVDHFRFFEKALSSLGFVGEFFPKPDSPCLYVPNNNGPDGCALFVKKSRFDLLEIRSKILEVWGCETNQVVIFCKLRRRTDSAVLWVATTHLKARTGSLLATLRREQGKDILKYLRTIASDTTPFILAGDMNAELLEPVHGVLQAGELQSAYYNQDPFYTSWTIRNGEDQCQGLDYIYYRKDSFRVQRLLRVPPMDDIGPHRVPHYRYPSDHFSLVADLSLRNNVSLLDQLF